MGGLKKYLPVTYRTFLVGTIAIAGIPPLAGFFSKDEILAATFGAGGAYRLLWVVGLLTAGLTACYMFRAVFMTFEGEFRGNAHERNHLHESPPVMTMPLVVLAVGAAVVGLIGIPEAITFGGATSTSSTTSSSRRSPRSHGHEAHGHLSLGGRVGADPAVGGDRGRRHPARAPDLGRRGRAWRAARPGRGASRRCTACSSNKYYVDELYDATVVRGTWGLAAAAVALRRRRHRRAGQLRAPLHGGDRAAVGVLRPLRGRRAGQPGGLRAQPVVARCSAGCRPVWCRSTPWWSRSGVLALVFAVVVLLADRQ